MDIYWADGAWFVGHPSHHERLSAEDAAVLPNPAANQAHGIAKTGSIQQFLPKPPQALIAYRHSLEATISAAEELDIWITKEGWRRGGPTGPLIDRNMLSVMPKRPTIRTYFGPLFPTQAMVERDITHRALAGSAESMIGASPASESELQTPTGFGQPQDGLHAERPQADDDTDAQVQEEAETPEVMVTPRAKRRAPEIRKPDTIPEAEHR